MHAIVRPIKESELPSLLQVWTGAGLPFRPTGRDSLENLGKQLAEYPDLFIGAFQGGRMIGAVIASDDGRKGWLNRLAVLPEFRGKGVAKMLVLEGEKALRMRGRGVFSILIEGDNPVSEGLFFELGYKLEKDIRYYAKRDSELI